MIIVDTNSDKKLVIAFQHLVIGDDQNNTTPTGTAAAVYSVDNADLDKWRNRNKGKPLHNWDNAIGYGETSLSIKDTFNRSIGRKLALKRALTHQLRTSVNDPKDLRLPYETRKAIWDAYFKVCKRN